MSLTTGIRFAAAMAAMAIAAVIAICLRLMVLPSWGVSLLCKIGDHSGRFQGHTLTSFFFAVKPPSRMYPLWVQADERT